MNEYFYGKNHFTDFTSYLRFLTDHFDVTTILSKLERTNTDCIFLSGSLVEGFGNEESDLDIYVIGDTTKSSIIDSRSINYEPLKRVLIQDCNRVDITYVSPKLIEQILDFLSSFSPDFKYADDWSENQKELVHRIFIGIPFSNHSLFNSILQRLNKSAFDKYLFSLLHRRVDSILFDIIGLQKEIEIESAIFLAKIRFNMIVDMWLVQKGQTNTRFDKWRIKKLHRAEVSAEMYGKFLQINGCEILHNDEVLNSILLYSDELLLSLI